jgi:hypothetical protein
MQITAPKTRPAYGLTIPIAEATLLPHAILARTHCGNSMFLVPLNAFAAGESYTQAHQDSLNRVLSQTVRLSATIPCPTSSRHPNWTKRLGNADPKPAWLWITDTETASDHLGRMSSIHAIPPYPTRCYQPPNIRPRTRPLDQLTMRCQVVSVESTDQVRCMGSDDHELPVALLDCYTRSEAAGLVASVLHQAVASYTVPLPPGRPVFTWLEQLRRSEPMAGWLWNHRGSHTLNRYLVEQGYARCDRY